MASVWTVPAPERLAGRALDSRPDMAESLTPQSKASMRRTPPPSLRLWLPTLTALTVLASGATGGSMGFAQAPSGSDLRSAAAGFHALVSARPVHWRLSAAARHVPSSATAREAVHFRRQDRRHPRRHASGFKASSSPRPSREARRRTRIIRTTRWAARFARATGPPGTSRSRTPGRPTG